MNTCHNVKGRQRERGACVREGAGAVPVLTVHRSAAPCQCVAGEPSSGSTHIDENEHAAATRVQLAVCRGLSGGQAPLRQRHCSELRLGAQEERPGSEQPHGRRLTKAQYPFG